MPRPIRARTARRSGIETNALFHHESTKVRKHEILSFLSCFRDHYYFFGKRGIFIQRTRRIDILLGGIFDEYVVYIESDIPDTIKIKPLVIVNPNVAKARSGFNRRVK